MEDEQYQAIVKFVFSMNDRLLDTSTPVPTVTITPTDINTPNPEKPLPIKTASPQLNIVPYIGFGIVLTVVVIWVIRNRLPKS